MTDIQPRICTLRVAAGGREEPCPGDSCAFWEPGGAVVDGGCSIERLGFDVRRGDIAAYLIELLERLEEARDLKAIRAAHRAFVRRLDPE
jgi:hypothetical protein